MLATQTRTRDIYKQDTFVPEVDTQDEEFEEDSSGFGSDFGNSFTTTTSQTEPAFEIEKEYNTTIAPQQDEYKVVRPLMQEVEKKQVLTQTKSKTALSPRLKIMITVYSLVFALLLGFSIYNAVAISNTASMLSAKQIEVSATTEVINDLTGQYNELGTDEAIRDQVSGDFVEADNSNTVIINKPDVDAVSTYQAPTNWFDKICEFFSSLF